MPGKPPPNILVTGAAGGFGQAFSMACAAHGAQLLLIDNQLRGLEALCDAVEGAGGPAPAYCALDLAEAGPDQVHELVSAFRDEYGELDALVHAAARFVGLQPMEQVAGDEWLRTLQVNLNAAWLLSCACLASLKSGDGGDLVFLLDTVRAEGSAYWGPYGVSKAAVRELALTFAQELEGSRVRVWGLAPGPMRTDLRARAFHAEDPATVPSPQDAAAVLASALCGNEPVSSDRLQLLA